MVQLSLNQLKCQRGVLSNFKQTSSDSSVLIHPPELRDIRDTCTSLETLALKLRNTLYQEITTSALGFLNDAIFVFFVTAVQQESRILGV